MAEMVFTQQQELLRKITREFVEVEIAPRAAEIDSEDSCPIDLLRKMGNMGFNGVFVPNDYGGAGLGYTERAIILEEIGRHAAGLAMALMTHHLGVAAILDYGTAQQKARYLPALCSGKEIAGLAVTEPGGGSDLMGQQTTAADEGDGWVVNGRKCFITNSHVADIIVVTAKTGVDAKGRAQLTPFIVEKGNERVVLGRKEKKVGLRGSSMGDINLNGAKVSKDAVLGNPGDGARVALSVIGDVGRSGMAAISVGIIRACLEEGIKFAGERIIYGKPLSKLANIQFAIAETRTEYEAARLLTYHAMGLKDSGKPCTGEVAIAKFFATEASVRAARRIMDLMGGYGVVEQYPVGRYLRDAVTTIPAGGTSHIMQIVIAGNTLSKVSIGG